MSRPRLVVLRKGTDYKGSDAKSWVPGLLNLVEGLKNRADAWGDLESYLKSDPDVTYEGINEYNHALQAKVFLHVDQALTPSTNKNYTGSLDSFTRVILMAAGLLPSDDFESCDYVKKEIFERCEKLGTRVRGAFEELDALSKNLMRFEHRILLLISGSY